VVTTGTPEVYPRVGSRELQALVLSTVDGDATSGSAFRTSSTIGTKSSASNSSSMK
jgi:hypothetical protein